MSLTQLQPLPATSSAFTLGDVLDALKAAGEETRLRILLLLSEGELTVTDLTRVLGQSQPRVSRHIKILLDAGLIERHREGSWIILRLAAASGLRQIIQGALESLAPDLPERRHDRAQLDVIKQERHEKAQAFFAREASNWNMLRSRHVDVAQVEAMICEFTGDALYEQIVDLGTGTGRIIELLGDRATRAIGFDVNADMLAYARVQLDRPEFHHCQVRQGDLFQLPQFAGSSDLVVLHQVLHVLSDPGAAVKEAARLLQPGGRALIVDFAPHSLEELRERESHARLGISNPQMKRWLREAGLNLLRHADLPPDTSDAGQNLTVSLWLAERAVVTPLRAKQRQ
ncbi:MAG: ArsR/SmtB family transcription factor [Hyphomicrobiaceae bacterium]